MKFLVAILLTTTLFGTISASADDVEGVLVLAHGSMMHLREEFPRDKTQCQIAKEHGAGAWEKAICEVVEEINKMKKAVIPVEIAFGMTDVGSFQHGVDRLVNSGMTKIRVIPLFISSYSDIIRQQKEIFGVTKLRGDGHQHGKVIYPKSVTKVIFENALDDAPEMSRILLQRAKELSRYPQIEELILVGHGPVKADDDVMWVQNFNIHNQRIQEELRKSNAHFNIVHAITVQDDAPTDVREAKTRALRQLVAQAAQRGHKALILPVLIAPGSIEAGILARLRGLNFEYVGHMLSPDPEITAWIANQIHRN